MIPSRGAALDFLSGRGNAVKLAGDSSDIVLRHKLGWMGIERPTWMEVVMWWPYVLTAWVSASFGACLGFMIAAMLHVASDADDREARYLNEHNHH